MADIFIQCAVCEGTGRVEAGRHIVTRDMAIDAGEPSMEGMDFGPEWMACPCCSGDGQIRLPDREAK